MPGTALAFIGGALTGTTKAMESLATGGHGFHRPSGAVRVDAEQGIRETLVHRFDHG